jgi:hypothetical protein
MRHCCDFLSRRKQAQVGGRPAGMLGSRANFTDSIDRIRGAVRAQEKMQPRWAVSQLWAALTCAAVMATGHLLTAHHSFSAEFDASQPIRFEGSVSRVEWTNPHVWLYIAVADPAGHVVTWAIEATAPSALARRGLRLENVPPGLKVIVSGYRAKNGTPTARGGHLTLPDGRTLSLGSPETASPDDPK